MIDQGLILIRCTTLIDISQTNTVSRFSGNTSRIDSTGRRLYNSDEFNFSRNQQRNFETLLQVIGLRAQAIYSESPTHCLADLQGFKFGSKFTGEHRVWTFNFGVEHTGVFDDDRPLGLLHRDIVMVPVILGLLETIEMPVSIFSSSGDRKNIYFEYV